MSTFYYWLPAERPYTNSAAVLEALRAAGLGYAVEDRITPRTCEGPDGQKGVVVCHGEDIEGRLGYWSAEQTWKRVPGSPAWCGRYTSERPRPDDLARATQISGEWLLLDDGHRWLAPKARRLIDMGSELLWDYNLPRSLTLNDEGVWEPGSVKPRYERLWQLAMSYADAASEALAASSDDDDSVRFAFPAIDSLAIGALQVNYRIGPVELDLLGIYDESARQRIVDVLLDDATRQAWLKKKLAELVRAGGNS